MNSITHLAPYIGNEADGVMRVIKDLSSSQANAGNIVNVLALRSSRSLNESQMWGKAKVVQYPVVGPQSFGYSPSLSTAIKMSKSKILHAHGLWMYPLVAGAASSGERTRLVVSPHGMLTPIALSYSSRKKRIAKILFQNRALKKASMLHATSVEEAQQFRDYGLAQPIAIIPNATSVPEKSQFYSTKRSKVILSLGRIHPVKGLDNLILAWSRIENQFPGWEVLIAGPDEIGHVSELKSLAKKIGVNRVRFSGPVFGEEKTELLAKASIFALPSKSENFALTVAESLAVGTPVISSKGAPWQGLQKFQCGWWVERNPQSFSTALQAAMSMSSNERKQMGERGRRWITNEFSWERSVKMMAGAYEWILNGGTPPDYVKIS